MIIECPVCHTKFNVKDELIPEEGRKVKCTKCQNIFVAQKKKPEEEEEVFHLDDGKIKEEPKKEDEKLEEELEKVAKKYKKPKPKKAKAKKGEGNKVYYLITLAMLIFAIVFSGAYLYFKTVNAKPPFEFAGLKGNFYENKKSGVILVIQGNIINTRNVSYNRIKLKAVVYDSSGKPVREGVTYVGNVFSEQELLNLTQDDLKALIYDQVVLKPKSQLPFMIVIYNPPKISYSFQVEVVDYKVFRKK